MSRNDRRRCNRRSVRLPNYNYSQPGAYFVTICAYNRECLFGTIRDGKTVLSDFGKIVKSWWQRLEQRYEQIELEFVIMPNHVHGIIEIIHPTVEAIHESPLQGNPENRRCMLLGKCVGFFKMNSSKQINGARNTPGAPVWQRNYYERVIRDDEELHRIRQ